MDDIWKNVAADEGAPGGAGVIGTATASATPKPTDNTGSTGGTGAGPGGSSGGSDDVLTFSPFEDRVYRAQNPRQSMNYTVQDNVRLIDATWVSRESPSQEFQSIAKAEFPSEKGEGGPAKAPFSSVAYNGVGFDLSYFIQPDGSVYLEKSMQLQIGWEMDDVVGSTTSGLFAVVNNGSPGQIGNINVRLKEEMDSEKALQGTQTISSSGSQRTGDSRTGEGGAPNASQSSLPGDSSSKGSGGGGGGGLSIGAKAGIGVGAALGALLIIGVLVWFLLRRRRQKKQLESGYKGQQSSNTYMVDKETQGRVTESPTSPYSDENQGQRVPLTDIETARETPATHAPYEDTPAPRSSLGSHNERGSGTQTPQGVSSNVAHLVEEGMTAEEIRRLEEEERQLDDEIERAARR